MDEGKEHNRDQKQDWREILARLMAAQLPKPEPSPPQPSPRARNWRRRAAFAGIPRDPQTAKQLSELKKELDTLKATRKPPRRGKLPPIKLHLSRYYVLADLTELQRECHSLRYERGLKLTDVARRMGLHHSTVQEHIKEADSRLAKLKPKQLSALREILVRPRRKGRNQ